MKKEHGRSTVTAILLFFVLAYSSCSYEVKKRILPTFSIDLPGIQLTVPPIRFVSPKELPIGALHTPLNLDSTLKANTSGTFGAAAITSVSVKQITLRVNNADRANNLGNFEVARMKIFNDSSSVEIFNLKFPQQYSDSITFFPTGHTEIVSYLKGKTLAYNLYWKNRKTTTKALTLRVNIKFEVQ